MKYKVRIVFKKDSGEYFFHENGIMLREYDTYKEAKDCIDSYWELPIVEHAHFVDENDEV